MENLLERYPHVIETPVAWGEMDSMQHVNNIVYFRWFESGRISYLGKVGLFDLMEETGVGPILATTQCKFKFPLTYPDTVSIGTTISKIEETQFIMEYRVVSQRLNRVAADGEGLMVTYNYRTKERVAVPDVIKHRIAEMEGRGGAVPSISKPDQKSSASFHQ